MADVRRTDDDLADCLATAALFTAILAASIAAMMLLARWGLATPAAVVTAPLLVVISAAFAPFAVGRWGGPRLDAPFAAPIVSLAVFLLPAMLGPWLGRAALVPHLLIAVAGIVHARPHLRRANLLVLAGAPLLAHHVFAEINRLPFAHVYAPESALLGLANPDTLYHAAIAGMLHQFGVVSMGLDGLVPHRYHVGSHLWFAGMSSATGASMIFTYAWAQAAALVPALLLALYQSASCVARRKDALLTVGAASVLVAVVDQLGLATYYISESFTLGLTMLVAFVPLLVHETRSPRLQAAPLAAGVVLGVAAFVTKVSSGAMIIAALLYITLRRQALRASTLMVAALMIVLAGALALASIPQYFLSFRLFGGLPDLHDHRWVMPLMIQACYLGFRWRMPHDPASGERLRTEVVVWLTVLAWAPILVLATSGITHYFFQSLMWIVMVLWVAEMTLDLHIVDPGQRRRAVAVALMLMVIVFGAPSGRDAVRRLKQQLYDRTGSGVATVRTPFNAAGAAGTPSFVSQLASSEGVAIVTAVQDGIGGTRERVAVFVDPGYAAFWGMHEHCWAQPFFIPALTGRPMLKGLPPDPQCEFAPYQAYSASSRSAVSTDTELCEAARGRKMEAVFVLTDARRADLNRLLQCGSAAALPPKN